MKTKITRTVTQDEKEKVSYIDTYLRDSNKIKLSVYMVNSDSYQFEIDKYTAQSLLEKLKNILSKEEKNDN